MRRVLAAAAGALALAAPHPEAGAAGVSGGGFWRTPDPADLLVVDTTKGRIVVELRDELAPQAGARVRLLARRGVYDGLLFHRVIDGFVDQTGNPNNRDGGGSELPNLPPEFDARLSPTSVTPAARRGAAVLGYLGSLPVEAQARPSRSGPVRVWGLYCAGVMGMGRQADPASANSEIFFMRAAARRLDHEYTAVGRVLQGEDVVRAIAPGNPPPAPDKMLRVRVAADLPLRERPRLEVLDERSPAFARKVADARARQGADFSPCAVSPTTRSPPRKDVGG